ncbi:hypothetical protein GCM10009411_01420 [Shewanella litoralis]|uniref:Uncharacterized protein n=1 Tax=Shewanella litoralis TaxID=2282700 RepID=A0ABQ2R0H6_9GAMM|nr:hypothetical protein GCM10009411_01420 [Shewanella litoralis]
MLLLSRVEVIYVSAKKSLRETLDITHTWRYTNIVIYLLHEPICNNRLAQI